MPLQITKMDITSLAVDAIVNAANQKLKNYAIHRGGGVCGAIFRVAGNEKMQAACDKIGFCETGRAVVTSGFAFEVDGVQYHTAEQYMMAQKAALMGDILTCEKIMAANDPKEYKALGREVQFFNAAAWDHAKYNIVLQGNLAKFSQNPELFAFLDGTGDSVLVEGSPYDWIWGVKLSTDDERIHNPNEWQGENLLGFALMETRDILRERS